MTSALLYKEFRETLPIAAIGCCALLLVAASSTNFRPAPGLLTDRQDAIPFLSDAFGSRLAIVGGVFALALGFWQTLGDFYRDAQLFLMHRPVARKHIYGVKLATGLAAYLVCTGLAILVHAIWAATPGNHASPFAWSMTLPAWQTWLSITSLYLAASLCGIYPAAWLGTRLAPLAAIGAIYSVVTWLPFGIDVLIVAVVDIALAVAILHIVKTRDFA